MFMLIDYSILPKKSHSTIDPFNVYINIFDHFPRAVIKKP